MGIDCCKAIFAHSQDSVEQRPQQQQQQQPLSRLRSSCCSDSPSSRSFLFGRRHCLHQQQQSQATTSSDLASVVLQESNNDTCASSAAMRPPVVRLKSAHDDAASTDFGISDTYSSKGWHADACSVDLLVPSQQQQQQPVASLQDSGCRIAMTTSATVTTTSHTLHAPYSSTDTTNTTTVTTTTTLVTSSCLTAAASSGGEVEPACLDLGQGVRLDSIPVMDMDVLVEQAGSAEVVIQLIELFQEQFNVQEATLLELLKEERWGELASEAHALKSATSCLFLGRLAVICDQCLQLGKACLCTTATLGADKVSAESKGRLLLLLHCLRRSFRDFQVFWNDFLVCRISEDIKNGLL